MILDIPNFIITSRTDADYWTHVSLIEPKGRLLFDYEQTDDFFEEYGKIYTKQKYGIAERPENVIPVLVDIDLKSSYKKELYTEEMLNKTVRSVSKCNKKFDKRY